jgi:hypothetical protein
MTRADRILAELGQRARRSALNRELSMAIFGTPHRNRQINGECQYLENKGLIARERLPDGRVLNVLVHQGPNLTLV